MNNATSLDETVHSHLISKDGKKALIDSIIGEYGYRWQIWKIIIGINLIFIIDGIMSNYFGSMIPAYQALFKLSNEQISLLGLIFFILKFIGSLITGYLAIFIKRLTVIYICSSFLTILTLLHSLFISFPLLIFYRVLIGLFCGIVEPLAMNLLCECLPIRMRGFFLSSVWGGFVMGQLIVNGIMLRTMPNFESSGLAVTFMFSAIISLFCLVFAYLMIRESPRYDLINKNYESAFETLALLKNKEFFTNDVRSIIIIESKNNPTNIEESTDFIDLFTPSLRYTTLVLTFLNLLGNLLNDGPVIIMAQFLHSINKTTEGDTLSQLILGNVLSFISIYCLGLMIEVKFLGRKYTLFSGFILLVPIIIPILIIPKYAFIFYGIYQFLVNNANLIQVYTSEVYSTKVRNFASGYVNAVGYMGSAASQYIFLYLYGINMFLPFHFMIGVSVASAIFCLFLKVETYHKPLDSVDRNEQGLISEEEQKLIESPVI